MSTSNWLNGTLSSDRLRITGGGEVVRFEGNVVMNIDNLPPAEPPASAAAAPAPEPRRIRAKTRPSPARSANPK